MNKKSFLKLSLGFAILAVLAGVCGLKTENVAAQKKSKTTVAKSKSLCRSGEKTIWTCTTTKNKLASVCGSKDLAEDKGYVQYRFGSPGNVELEYPKMREGSAQKFKYSRYTRPLVTMLTVEFENEGVRYEIHDDDNSEEKPPVRAASIDVANGARSRSVVCRLPVSGSLMELENIVPRKDDN